MTIRKISINGVKYVASYDEYDVLDTITDVADNALLLSTNVVAKKIARNADKILCFKPVAGIEYV